MGSNHFEKLDEEGRALHDSWDHIARVVVLVTLLAGVVWGACTALRQLVHAVLAPLMHASEEGTLAGAATLVVALVAGALVRGLLMRREEWRAVAGDGMETALANYHVTYEYEGDDPQPRYERPAFVLAARKFLATFLTLGSGASGGLEAPLVMVSESISAGFARVFRIRSEYELRTYQLAGISAAVATLLGAPFTGALFATEVAYGDRIIYRKLAYALWAGVVCWWLNNWLKGRYEPLFIGPTHSPTYSAGELGASALVAVAVSVPVALGFGMTMARLQALVGRLRPAWHAVVCAVAAGAIALVLFKVAGLAPKHILGIGEETLADILLDKEELGAWWLVALILLGKVVTTGLTMVGRGSAGMLIPSMFLGGVAGALVAKLLNLLGGPHLDPALFAVVGIGSSLVAVVGVPLAAIALVFEVFGKAFGPPAIVACGVTYLVTLRIKIYKHQRSSPAPLADESG
ncbi:MAG: chloride channel protein [Labilithrix sp.]|nr:chloride channel protein [Labilithrix sp.]MCW5809832.1 chloride channel protein [Labilithrix sp.]